LKQHWKNQVCFFVHRNHAANLHKNVSTTKEADNLKNKIKFCGHLKKDSSIHFSTSTNLKWKIQVTFYFFKSDNQILLCPFVEKVFKVVGILIIWIDSSFYLVELQNCLGFTCVWVNICTLEKACFISCNLKEKKCYKSKWLYLKWKKFRE